MSKAYENRQAKRTARNFARGPIADRTHRLPTLFGVEHPSRGALNLLPASTITTPAATEVLTPSITGPSQISPSPLLMPMIPIPSICDEPILTDDDFAILNEPVDATTTIDEDAEGEIDAEADQSVVFDKI